MRFRYIYGCGDDKWGDLTRRTFSFEVLSSKEKILVIYLVCAG